MESLHRLGIETINITPCERTDLYCSSCPEFRYRYGKVLGIQPHSTRRPASTHCIPNLSPIKWFSNRLFLNSCTY